MDATRTGRHEEYVDTVVVGAGQCGLALGHHLARDRAGGSFVILDEEARVGDSWRRRYDSLRLYTPARLNRLPGRAFPAGRHEFPTGHQMADFLEAYARDMDLPVRSGVRVDAVDVVGPDPRAGGGFLVSAGALRFECRSVVVATGGQRLPYTPAFASDLDPGIRQLHSDDYRNPSQLQPGPVLVVGASHSGADLALEASEAEHPTVLSGPVRGQLPFDLEGRPARFVEPVMWFMANHVLTLRTPIGRKMAPEVRGHGGPLLRVKLPHLRDAGVEHTEAKVVGVQDGRPMLADGRVLDVANILWCTGFRRDYGWIPAAVVGADGFPVQRRGVVEDVPGLYFLGLLFQYAFASMLVGGAGRDAEHVARHIAASSRARGSRAGAAA